MVKKDFRGCEGECRGCGVREKQRRKENDRLMEKVQRTEAERIRKGRW